MSCVLIAIRSSASTTDAGQRSKNAACVKLNVPQKTEKHFIDYSGAAMPVINRSTGEIQQAQIFVATLGASSYTFSEATWTQTLLDWVGFHTRALKFFGCVTELHIPDSLRSAVTKADRYHPMINTTYADMATHYATAVMLTKAYKPYAEFSIMWS